MIQYQFFLVLTILSVSFAVDVKIENRMLPIDENFTSVRYSEYNIPSVSDHGKTVACFYNSKASKYGYNIETKIFNGKMCTHLVYKAGILEENTFDIIFEMHGSGKQQPSLRNQILILKRKFPHLKILMYLGGNYEAQSQAFNKIVQRSESKKMFIQQAVQFLIKNELDGLHINWQFPKGSDKEKFIKLALGLKEKFNGRFILTCSMGGFKTTVEKNYDAYLVTRIFDLVILQSYGYNDNPKFVNRTSHMSPLNSTDQYMNTYDVLKFLIVERNGNPDTVVLGTPFYGYTYSFDKQNISLYGLGEASGKKKKKGYGEICAQIFGGNEGGNDSESWSVYWDEFAKVPFAKSDIRWITFNNPQSVFERARLANQFGLAGIMISSLDYDDHKSNCSKENKNSLLKTVIFALNSTKDESGNLLCKYMNENHHNEMKIFTPNKTTPDINFVSKNSYFELHCMTEGNPLPNITWYQMKNGKDEEILNYKESDYIIKNLLRLNCSGFYQKMLSILTVTNFDPPDGKAHFSCNVNAASTYRSEFDVRLFLSSSTSASPWPWLAGIFAVVMLILPIATNVYLKAKYKSVLTSKEIQKFHEGDESNSEMPALNNGVEMQSQNPNNIPYNQDYEVRKNDYLIEKDKIIGSGAFGFVYRGKVSGQVAAVKTVKNVEDRNSLISLLSELKIMIYLGNHLNVVNLLGAHTSELKKGLVFVFCELCPYGDLLKYLRNIRPSFLSVLNDDTYSWNTTAMIQRAVNETVTEETFICWSIQIASGLEHLRLKKVIHGDLAARNILVFDKNVVKISDFGLSRKVYMYGNYQKSNNLEPLPWRWMAIESLRDLEFSCQSDIWSFAVTMWEIFTLGETPFSGMAWTMEFVEMLASNLRICKPKYATNAIYNIMAKCWNPNPLDRPRPVDIQAFLGSVLIECFQKDDECGGQEASTNSQ